MNKTAYKGGEVSNSTHATTTGEGHHESFMRTFANKYHSSTAGSGQSDGHDRNLSNLASAGQRQIFNEDSVSVGSSKRKSHLDQMLSGKGPEAASPGVKSVLKAQPSPSPHIGEKTLSTIDDNSKRGLKNTAHGSMASPTKSMIGVGESFCP